MPDVNVVESFYSIQGEGRTIGSPAFFIRFEGCNLRCSWCDSKHASRGSKDSKPFDVEELKIPSYCNRIVLTGGEPTIHPLHEIINRIQVRYDRNFVIEVETNGTNIVPDFLYREVDQWNVSPKHNEMGWHGEDHRSSLAWWAEQRDCKVIFKFVVSKIDDVARVAKLVDCYGISPNDVYIMREGAQRELFIQDTVNYNIIEKCKLFGFNYSTRLHIILWGNERGV